VSGTALEVADVFRDHGAAWRDANRGHVSLGQLKVMSAIERCRTAALGGHVARCETCPHTVIGYNSCRNRHCPKCQGAAAREWLAEREAELLPVPYFHVVYTLPGPIADIAYQNKRVIYDLLFRASAQTTITIAADPKHLGAKVAITSVLHTWGSAMTHHPHVHMIVPGGGLSADASRWIACRPNFFLPVRVLSRLFRRLFLTMLAAAHEAGQLKFFGDHAGLTDNAAFATFLAPWAEAEWVVYAKGAIWRPRGGAAVSLTLHAPRRHLEPPARLGRRRRRHVQMQGLPDRRTGPVHDDDAAPARVHPALPDARPAERAPSHPPLWASRQWQSRRQHRARPPAACYGATCKGA
jgi:Transposase zinc-binding domain/Putative transposase